MDHRVDSLMECARPSGLNGVYPAAAPRKADAPEISVVIPVYNSEETAYELCDRLRDVLSQMGVTHEVIFVDDGSRDKSAQRFAERAKANPIFRLVKMIRNFGQLQAIAAGLELSRGKWVVILDDDLQNPPEEIPRLYEKALEGFDVVYGARAERADSWFRRTASKICHKLFCGLFGAQPADTVSSYRIISRRVVSEFIRLPERHTYVAALISWMGFPHTSISVRHDPRKAGRSNYSLRKLARMWLNIVFGFSDRPLHIAMWVGGLFSVIAFLLFARTIVAYFTSEQPLLGYSSLFAGQMLFSGITLLVLGIVGEYLARIYQEVKQRPPFILDREGSVPSLPPVSDERTPS